MTRDAASSTPPSEPHRLPVRTRRTYEANGTERIQLSVFCPTVRGSTAVTECLRCTACGGVSVDEGVPSQVLCDRGLAPAAESLGAAAALRTALFLVAPTDVVCIRASAALSLAEDVVGRRSLDGIVVVDNEDRPLGCVAASALLARHANREVRIGFECAGPRGGVAEDATVSLAIGWMAQTGLPVAPVVSASDTLISAFSASDLARWLAAAEGFGPSRGR